MKIRSVAVLGAGAVGAYILYGLSQTKDVDFCVVADGARKERLVRDGILIDNKKSVQTFRPAVRTPQEARGVDLLLVAVKYTALDSVLEDIRTIAAPGTVVLSAGELRAQDPGRRQECDHIRSDDQMGHLSGREGQPC